jgi:phosphatidylserine/phosphatidylglycerophosphate/cardiolipin synthase-like enzyme
VQLLRTYGRRRGGYPFAPDGERSVARGYLKALREARRLIYIEDQYLWSTDIGSHIAAALTEHKDLRVVAVLPHHPDQDGRLSKPPNVYGRQAAFDRIRRVAPDRVAVYGVENEQGTPIYVHAKVCIIDDLWASTGSDNFNRRSWTHDSELTAAVWDTTEDGTARYARDLRRALAEEHVGGPLPSDDPLAMVAAFAESSAALQRWHDGGRRGERPPGQLRPLADTSVPQHTRLWAEPIYRTVFDPDARRMSDRIRGRY